MGSLKYSIRKSLYSLFNVVFVLCIVGTEMAGVGMGMSAAGMERVHARMGCGWGQFYGCAGRWG